VSTKASGTSRRRDARASVTAGLQQWERDQTRRMTERLYERRIAAYPDAMRLPEPLRLHCLQDFEGDTAALLDDTLRELDEWHCTAAAFIISARTLDTIYGLRAALRIAPSGPDQFTDEEIARLFEAKNAFRKSLHDDIELLFHEDS
jgi:hypothetical protein